MIRQLIPSRRQGPQRPPQLAPKPQNRLPPPSRPPRRPRRREHGNHQPGLHSHGQRPPHLRCPRLVPDHRRHRHQRLSTLPLHPACERLRATTAVSILYFAGVRDESCECVCKDFLATVGCEGVQRLYAGCFRAWGCHGCGFVLFPSAWEGDGGVCCVDDEWQSSGAYRKSSVKVQSVRLGMENRC